MGNEQKGNGGNHGSNGQHEPPHSFHPNNGGIGRFIAPGGGYYVYNGGGYGGGQVAPGIYVGPNGVSINPLGAIIGAIQGLTGNPSPPPQAYAPPPQQQVPILYAQEVNQGAFYVSPGQGGGLAFFHQFQGQPPVQMSQEQFRNSLWTAVSTSANGPAILQNFDAQMQALHQQYGAITPQEPQHLADSAAVPPPLATPKIVASTAPVKGDKGVA